MHKRPLIINVLEIRFCKKADGWEVLADLGEHGVDMFRSWSDFRESVMGWIVEFVLLDCDIAECQLCIVVDLLDGM